MTDTQTCNQLFEIMMNEDDSSLETFLLMESERDDILASLGGDTTLINYLYLFEEFLDQHDIYLFDGWNTASIVGQPVVEKFWVTITMAVNADTDMRGANRVCNALDQGSVTVSKAEDGQTTLVKFSILKRALDQIEKDNKERIEKLSDDALEDL